MENAHAARCDECWAQRKSPVSYAEENISSSSLLSGRKELKSVCGTHFGLSAAEKFKISWNEGRAIKIQPTKKLQAGNPQIRSAESRGSAGVHRREAGPPII